MSRKNSAAWVSQKNSQLNGCQVEHFEILQNFYNFFWKERKSCWMFKILCVGSRIHLVSFLCVALTEMFEKLGCNEYLLMAANSLASFFIRCARMLPKLLFYCSGLHVFSNIVTAPLVWLINFTLHIFTCEIKILFVDCKCFVCISSP